MALHFDVRFWHSLALLGTPQSSSFLNGGTRTFYELLKHQSLGHEVIDIHVEDAVSSLKEGVRR